MQAIAIQFAEGERLFIHVKDLISEVIKNIRKQSPSSLTIRSDIPDDLWPLVGNPTQLQQVLINLCINASDEMPHGGVLSISAENSFSKKGFAFIDIEAKPGPYIIISISDTGNGIPSEILRKIFDPFFTNKRERSGDALSTALAIVKSHGGFINVQVDVGKGSTFKMYFPAATINNARGDCTNDIDERKTSIAHDLKHNLPC